MGTSLLVGDEQGSGGGECQRVKTRWQSNKMAAPRAGVYHTISSGRADTGERHRQNVAQANTI